MLVLRNVMDISAANCNNVMVLQNDLITTVSPLQYPPHYDQLDHDTREIWNAMNDIVAGVPGGIYSLSRSGIIHKFTKYRGDYCTNGQFFHIEVIYKTTGRYMRPMIVRLWRLSDMARMEYLFTNEVLSARHDMFNLVGGDTILGNILFLLQESSDDLIGGASFKFVPELVDFVPNVDGSYYSNGISQTLGIQDVLTDFSYGLNTMVNNLYLGLHTHEVVMLSMQLRNNVPLVGRDIMRVQCTGNCDKVAASITIESLDMYYVIHQFAMIPYDSYTIFYTVDNGSIKIAELDCMSNVNTPFIAIEPMHDVFRWVFMKLTAILVTNPLFINSMQTIIVERSFDEELAIEVITADDIHFVISIDLILLSILSPVIGSYRK